MTIPIKEGEDMVIEYVRTLESSVSKKRIKLKCRELPYAFLQ